MILLPFRRLYHALPSDFERLGLFEDRRASLEPSRHRRTCAPGALGRLNLPGMLLAPTTRAYAFIRKAPKACTVSINARVHTWLDVRLFCIDVSMPFDLFT